MKETTFNMEDYILCIEAAKSAVLFKIPEVWQLRNERIVAKEKFFVKQQKDFEKLLSDISDVATEVFGTEFPVKEGCSKNYDESFRELLGIVSKAYSQTLRMSFIQKKIRMKKLRKAMKERFGIKIIEKESDVVFRILINIFIGNYSYIFNRIRHEYYKEVTKIQEAEEEAEKCVISTLSHISTRDLVPMWKEGREKEVISNCADVIDEYQAYAQGILKENIKEFNLYVDSFQYCGEDQKA